MSKRYPPIFNVILFAVAVCIILANPMTMLMPWISTVTNLIVFAVSSISTQWAMSTTVTQSSHFT